jgi:hypothetical protein
MKRNEKLMKRKFITFISLSVEAKNLMQKEAKNVNFISLGSERGKYDAKLKSYGSETKRKKWKFYFPLVDAIFHRYIRHCAKVP